MLRDIENKADLVLLVDTFYDRVNADKVLEPIFNDIARIDWDSHLPKMYAFWDSILFHTSDYRGNPMAVHTKLHSKSPLTEAQFDIWLELFNKNVDQLFKGPNADMIKVRALSIATVLQIKTSAAG